MLRHNLLLIYRSFNKYRSTFVINLVGLSTGLACALLIYLWVNDELSVDKFHEKDDQLFQVMTKFKDPSGGIKTGESTPNPLGQALAEEMPEVEYATTVRLWTSEQGIISVGDKHIRANEQYVSKDYFNVFSYPVIEGNRNRILTDKNEVLISDVLAKKMFNTTENVVGKSIEWNKEALSGSYLIGGVFRSPSRHSTAQFDLLFSFELYRERKPRVNEWSNGGTNTYIILKKGVGISQFNKKIENYLQKKNKISEWSIFITRYSDKYLHGKYENGIQTGGRIEYVSLFFITAIFILVIACINFMNLSTARASRRIKEIGVKKAMGAARKVLIFQYLSESISVAFLTLIVAVLLIFLLLPQFNEITGKHLSLLDFDFNLMVSFFFITLFTGIISGSYPALYLSSFKPSLVLKGKLGPSTGASWARKGLVIFQFAVSIILIVAVIVVYQQTGFIQSKSLGYNKDNLILFRKEGNMNKGLETFLHELKNIPGVVNASTLWGNMTTIGNMTSDVVWEGKRPDVMIDFGEIDIGYDLLETLDVEIKEGRSYSRSFGADSSRIIFNEAAIAAMGLKNPIGKTVRLWGQEREIVGVISNFHSESLYEPLKPCFMILAPYVNNVIVKIKTGTEREAIERIQKFYKEYNTEVPFDFKFMDESFQELYAAENRVAKLSWYFAGLAILISCLGLFGLAAFTAERRLKEIGIRKVFGSTDFDIARLLSGEFMKMVLIAIIIALPISYLIAENWLSAFTYHIALQWWFFIGAGLLALLIAWVTVGIQTFKATRISPTMCLKDE